MPGGNTVVAFKRCPMCNNKIRVSKINVSLRAVMSDEDRCTYYEGDVNPYLYDIWVCENCGFAGEESFFSKDWSEDEKAKIQGVLAKKKIKFIFSQDRSLPDAVSSYLLADWFNDLTGGSMFQKARLNLRIAWLYRFAGSTANEREYMEKAKKYFELSLMKDKYPQGVVSKNDVIYRIAAIYYRLGYQDKAKEHLAGLVYKKDLQNANQRLYERIHSLWAKLPGNALEATIAAEKNKEVAVAGDKSNPTDKEVAVAGQDKKDLPADSSKKDNSSIKKKDPKDKSTKEKKRTFYSVGRD